MKMVKELQATLVEKDNNEKAMAAQLQKTQATVQHQADNIEELNAM